MSYHKSARFYLVECCALHSECTLQREYKMIYDRELTENLEQFTAFSDEEIKRLWAEEALRRNAELDSGTASIVMPKMYLEMQELESRKIFFDNERESYGASKIKLL